MEYLKRLFQGRINRKNYIAGLFINFIFFATAIIYAVNFMNSLLGIFIEGFLLLISFVFYFSIYFRRLHDFANRDNEAEISYLIPRFGVIFALFDRGNPNKNNYGKPPKAKIDIKNLLCFS